MKGGRLSPDLASECAAVHIDNIKTQDLVTESGKLVFLIKLVDRLKTEGHRCLIFSQSLKGHSIIRLDGSIRQLPEREKIIEKFTNDTSINVFLLTTQVS
ncbi:hypothetical protein NP493_58g04028 [Ridgeia piscesae]|uniref:Uncharacterized protein n=1 Tax=Ridgeia piscesae TaxID=27915 RepID=A0AAD9PAK9_RIDPI|nr:hypothetical protein NP493_58g04028 [Ridgeia piscesae]